MVTHQALPASDAKRVSTSCSLAQTLPATVQQHACGPGLSRGVTGLFLRAHVDRRDGFPRDDSETASGETVTSKVKCHGTQLSHQPA